MTNKGILDNAILGTVEPNFEMYQGDLPNGIIWAYMVKKTLLNRFKYWMFFKFFPFKLKRWDK